MPSRRDLDDKLQDAADALRAVAESGSDDKDNDSPRERRDLDSDGRGSYRSGGLHRLSNALLEAIDALREIAEARYCEADYDDNRACCARCPGGSQPPMPPYPPYPPYAPHAPFPPYPPYPPVVVIGGGSGCGCTCHQNVPVAGQMPASTFQSVPGAPTSVPEAQSQVAQPSGAARTAAATSVGSIGFPDTGNLQQVETLLDVGESAAAMVNRALSQQQEGAPL
jgi:hypothetical protein